MNKEDFLQNLKTRIGRRARNGDSRFVLEPLRVKVESLLEKFTEESAKVGVQVHLATSETLGQELCRHVREKKLKRIALPARSLLPGKLAEDLSGELAKESELFFADQPEPFLSSILQADLGISVANYAIAETGTLVLCAEPALPRSLSLLPPYAAVILKEENIFADMCSIFDIIYSDNLKMPSNMTFMTGPSRSADIEMSLAVGVHGPKEVDVFVTRENKTPVR